MSQTIQRGVGRLQANQQSRGVAWIMFIAMLPTAFFSFVSLGSIIQSGAFPSAGGIASGVALLSALWVAGHLFREARRLGKLLKDPERIMRSERDPDLVGGIQWSGLLPFSGWRD